MDRVNLPYTDAVLHEVMRMANTVPLGIAHFTNNDVQLGGYTIPKVKTITDAVSKLCKPSLFVNPND